MQLLVDEADLTYEERRNRNIKRNAEALARLGVPGAIPDMSAEVKAPKKYAKTHQFPLEILKETKNFPSSGQPVFCLTLAVLGCFSQKTGSRGQGIRAKQYASPLPSFHKIPH